MTDTLRRLRRQRQIKRTHRLSPRVLAELLVEIERRDPGLAVYLDERLARYAALDAETLAVTGGNRFAASPVRLLLASC
jgi:hypothetical protein